jgi:hypothetical protein
VAAGHLALVLWLFGDTLAGRLPYFRDITFYYFPNDVFLERWLRRGVWPLWNPEADGGGPFLAVNPVELLSIGILGARAALGFCLLAHLYAALLGASLMARRLGLSATAAWLGGALYGLSGFVLSTVNLRPLFEACALAPWLLWAFLGLLQLPSPRRAALLGALGALQLLTLGVEISLQTALAGLLLAPQPRALPGRLRQLALAGLVTLLLAAPALLGVHALTRDTERAAGFTRQQALGYSASPMVLAESLLPRLFGDVHSFSDAGYWGQPFYPEGYPYLLSLYLGPLCLGLALAAGRSRLWLLAAAGIVLSLGEYGPLGPALPGVLPSFRAPVKFFFLTTLALPLLAAHGFERSVAKGRAGAALVLAGVVPLAIAAALVAAPETSLAWLGRGLPEVLAPLARPVLLGTWPHALLATGSLAIAAALLLRLAPPLRGAAALLPVLDLLIVNGALNPLTEASYYELQPRMRAAVERALPLGEYRWFGYGVGNSPPLPWRRVERSDLWLYYMDRQALMPRAPMLDGLASAYDVDRTGWAPRGSTLSVAETSPLQFRNHCERLRLANVRFVLSFVPLPADLTTLRETIAFDEILTPLRLYEIRRPLPRAFWVARADAVEQGAILKPAAGASIEPRPDAQGSVLYERPDPHTLRIRSSGPAGYVVVVEGPHPDWQAESGGAPVRLLAANGRAWALPVPDGGAEFTVRYRPAWVRWGLGFAAGGLLLAVAMALWRGASAPRA